MMIKAVGLFSLFLLVLFCHAHNAESEIFFAKVGSASLIFLIVVRHLIWDAKSVVFSFCIICMLDVDGYKVVWI